MAALSDDAKAALLARRILAAAEERGEFTIADGLRAGFTEAEVKRLYEPALARARTIDNTLLARCAQ